MRALARRAARPPDPGPLGVPDGPAGPAAHPGHDGVRLFLPAFGVLALLAGLGASSRWSSDSRSVSEMACSLAAMPKGV